MLKERNKPKEPVKPVKSAPFFLPTQPGLQLKFISAPDIIPSYEVILILNILININIIIVLIEISIKTINY